MATALDFEDYCSDRPNARRGGGAGGRLESATLQLAIEEVVHLKSPIQF